MRRTFSAILATLLVAGVLPLTVLAALPVASAAAQTTNEDTAVTVTLHASDADGDASTFAITTPPAHGTLGSIGTVSCDAGTPNVCTADIVYTPASNWNGADAFGFTATANGETTAEATASITVTPANDAPVAGDDFGLACISSFWQLAFPIPEDYVFGPQPAGLPCSLDANDSDPDGDSLTFELVTQASHGTAAVAADGSWSYTGAANFFTDPTVLRSDSFTYRVGDGSLWSAPATAWIHVAGVNDPPTFTTGSNPVAVAEDSGPYSARWATAISPGPGETGQAVTFDVSATNPDLFATAPAISPAGVLTFTPSSQWSGSSTVTVTAHDDGGLESWGIAGVTPDDTADPVTFAIHVTAVNDGPTPEAGSSDVVEDTPTLLTLRASDVEGDATTAFTAATAPAHGSLSIGNTETCNGQTPNDCTVSALYTPAANYHGPDSFTFRASDGTTVSGAVTLSLNVTPVNDAPTCTGPWSSTGAEDALQSGTLVCADVDGDTLAYALGTAAAHGTAIVAAGGGWTYQPALNWSGTDGFTFTASDGTATTAPATVSLTVGAVNDPPVATPQTLTTNEDTNVQYTLTGTDAEGSSLTFAIVTPPAHGTLTGPAANRRYNPDANWNGTDSFTFKANDGTQDSGPGTITVNVLPVNDAPVASPQAVSVTEDTPKAITLAGTDVDGDSLTYLVATQPAHGTLSGSAPDVTYTPAANYSGADSFTFRANDGTVSSTVAASVSITVTAVNDAPTATAQAVTTAEDIAKAVTLAGSDPDGDPLTYQVTTGPAHGTLSGAAPSLTYTPALNYHGPDSFTFTVADAALTSAAATVDITVTAANDAPVATSQAVSTPEDTAKAVTLAGTDVDGDPLTYAVAAGPAHGSLTGTAPNLTYTPAADYNGPDSFTFRANDGSVNSPVATVSVTVTAVNDRPTATSQSPSATEDVAKAITLAGTDVDGDALTYTVVSGPSHGSLTGAAPNLTYTGAANYNGPDSFTFKVSDGLLESAAVATVSITVVAANDAPVVNAQAVSTSEDIAKAITLTGSDIEGSPLTFTVVAGPVHGTLTGSAPSLAYTPASNYNGADSFTFRANDGALDSAAATVSITVAAVNDAPVCSGVNLSTGKNVPTAGSVTCTDVEGTPLVLAVASPPANGTVNLFNAVTGAFTYTPDTGFTGSDSFTVTATDGDLVSLPATVGIGVANRAPVCEPASPPAANEDTPQAGSLACSDADADPMTYELVAQAGHGTAAVDRATGAWTYAPDPDYNGPDSFTASAIDLADASAPATISLVVTAVNDAPVCDPDTSTGDEEEVQSGTVTCSDVDSSSGSLVYALVSAPAKGTASVDAATGRWTFTPLANLNGAFTFTFTASDGVATSAPQTVSLTINDVNDAPVARDDGAIVTATTTTTIPVLNGDPKTAVGRDYSGPPTGGSTSEPGDTITVTAVTQGSKGSVSIASGGAAVVYDPKGCSTGGDSFTYTITDSHGLKATAYVIVTIARPGQYGRSSNPITDTPSVGLVTNSTISSTIPARIAWCGVTRSGYSVKSYRLDQSSNGGSTYPTNVFTASKSTSSTRSLKLATTYRWRVRTVDSANRTGSYRLSPTARVARIEDASSQLKYSATGWAVRSSSSATSGTMRYASSTSASVSLTVTGVRQIGIVGPKGSGFGSIQVRVDGVLVATVKESASTTVYRRVLYVRSINPAASHVVELRPAGNGRIYLDAIVTLQ